MDRPTPEKLRDLGERVSFTYAADDANHRGCAVTETVTIVGRSFQQPYRYDLMFGNGTIRHAIPSADVKDPMPEQRRNLLKFSRDMFP